MLQTISMLDFRKKAGQVIDETQYRKDRFLIKRKDRPVAILAPVEDYDFLLKDNLDIEIYSQKRIREFERQDRLTVKQRRTVQKLLK